MFDRGNPLGEKNTWRVVALTATMMVVEIITGGLFHSMALLADGWHMSTHVAALGMTAIAYLLARRYASDARFAFGTWKIEVLGGFASAIVLLMVAMTMAAASAQRLLQPLEIQYGQALVVAIIGLLVNLTCAYLLKDHGGGHAHRREGGGQSEGDLNLQAAYLHVLADAMTSVLAIVALLGGMVLAWAWLDPVMGIAGAAVIGLWSYGLLRDTSRVLLDREMDHAIVQEIRHTLEAAEDTRIADLHVWRVGRAQFACLVSVVTAHSKTPDEYRGLLRVHEEVVHVTVEVLHRPDQARPLA